jgi:WD40 repeat protein
MPRCAPSWKGRLQRPANAFSTPWSKTSPKSPPALKFANCAAIKGRELDRFSPDGSMLVSASTDGTVLIWDTREQLRKSEETKTNGN